MPSPASVPPPGSLLLAERLVPELGPGGPEDIPAPPAAPEDERSWPALLLPVVSALGMLGFALLARSVVALVLGGSFAAISALAAIAAARHQRRRRERAWAIRESHYRGELAASAESLAVAAGRQRAHALATHPAPGDAAAAALTGEVWERRAGSESRLAVRLGIGRVPARRWPREAGRAEAGAAAPLRALAGDVLCRLGGVDGVPLTLDLATARTAAFLGDQLPQLRAVIVSLTRALGPQSVRIHALAAPAEQEWLRRLPHAGYVAAEPEAFAAQVRALLQPRERFPEAREVGLHHVIVAAAAETAVLHVWRALAPVLAAPGSPASLLAMLPSDAAPPALADVVISRDTEGGLLLQHSTASPARTAVALPDALSHAQALRYCAALRRIAGAAGVAETAATSPTLAGLLATGERHPLQLPIGLDDEGMVAALDLREAACGGDGPHGLIVGATGSGKSELLRTLLSAAAAQNSPHELTFLLVDFKGGAALSAVAELPHTAGLLTNLTGDPHGVERLCAALRAELRHRQSLLREAGAGDIEEFRARAGGWDSGPLPRLLVVVDEYAELIEQSPDALDVLTSLARLGRSLGIHLLLCSQRLDDGRLRGLEAHLRYRVCLRTFTATESLAALGSPVAAHLPPAPGWGYASRDGHLQRLRVALAGDPAALAPAEPATVRRARQVCPPPLPEVVSLDRVLRAPCPAGSSGAAIGVSDRPDLGEQPPLRYDLATGGQLAVAGAPRSGRSTTLTTLVAALALGVPARELDIHVVTAAGSPLVATAGLPHVGTVATTPPLARRVIHTVAEAVAERRSHNDGGGSRIMLVIDDLAAVLAADDELASAVHLIATTGQSVGVSLAVSCGRWADLRGGISEAIATRLELAGNDPSDSMLPRVARTLPRRPAGRVITGDGYWAQVALPRTDGVAAVEGSAAALAELVAALARRGGPATQPIQLLPALVPASSLAPPASAGSVVIGVTGPYAQPAEVALAPGEHLLVLGNPGSGRSGLLRSVAVSLHREGARLWVVDPRRSFAGLEGVSFLRATTGEQAEALVGQLLSRSRGAAAGRDVLIIDDQELVSARGAAGGGLIPLLEALPFAAEAGLSVVSARRLSGFVRAAYEPFFAGFIEHCDNAVVLSGDPAEGAVIGGVRPARLPPGRGRLVVRGELVGEVQAAWLAPGAGQSGAPATPSRHTAPASRSREGM